MFHHTSILCNDAISREKAFVPLSNGMGYDVASETRLKKLLKLQSLISGALIRTKAKAYLDNKKSTATTMCPMIGGGGSEDGNALPFISERLGAYSCAAASQGFGIATFPPSIVPVIAHAVVLDTALDLVPCPEFKEEAGILEASQVHQDSGVMNWLKFW